MKTFIAILVIGIAVLAILSFDHIPDFEETKCPFCYGQELCNHKENFTLRMSSISDIINNLFSVKNVYFTTNIVLKKLGHTENLNLLDQEICTLHNEVKNCDLSSLNINEINYQELLRKTLESTNKGYRICGKKSIDIILNRLLKSDFNLINLWTISLINFEVIFYTIFDYQQFLLPRFYGACGRVIAVENCGKPMNAFENHDWITRATIARSIIDLFSKFTEGDDDFRIYLTDISPDNIVVDDATLTAKFVDFGNIILTQRTNTSIIHKSENYFDDNGFAYFEDDICQSSVSDHNIYGICKLLFAQNAPWPMMTGGLLHTIPDGIQLENLHINKLVESCIQSTDKFDRFETIRMLDDKLKDILRVHKTV